MTLHPCLPAAAPTVATAVAAPPVPPTMAVAAVLARIGQPIPKNLCKEKTPSTTLYIYRLHYHAL